jgi:hypothetical protein
MVDVSTYLEMEDTMDPWYQQSLGSDVPEMEYPRIHRSRISSHELVMWRHLVHVVLHDAVHAQYSSPAERSSGGCYTQRWRMP